MATGSVKNSRQGDKFHYRWAARRSLKLLDPNTTLNRIEIEGSEDNELKGEDVIDLTEYSKIGSAELVIYYQLKHSTRSKNGRKIPFRISELSKTLKGFAERFTAQLLDAPPDVKREIRFAIVTNRKLERKLRSNLSSMSTAQCTDTSFITKLTKATGLNIDHLPNFCSLLDIQDSEGDFQVQDQQLRVELNQIMASDVDSGDLAKLYEMISNKVTGEKTNVIKEEVLATLDTSEHQLFPAPPRWEPSVKLVERESYQQITELIMASEQSVIVHAPGGVGKSVFTQQLAAGIGEGSVVVTYDCFGAGKYRTKSTTRHQHRIGLVQMANELAVKGLTKLFIVKETTPESEILRKFLRTIQLAVDSIKEAYPEAILLLVIDAADNAEMAAAHFEENSFASDLLAENIPEGCKLVLLCRTERVKLLKSKRGTPRIQLEKFSLKESKVHLRNYFAEATDSQAEEFHRLTSCNPRVQANALNAGPLTVQQLLTELGPRVMTVEKQIKQQLDRAIDKVRFSFPEQQDHHIDHICKGLACLPPNIPLTILAKAANVDEDSVYSFVTDFGRSLWVSDTAVHFRDEPTETWFRDSFMSSSEDFAEYAVSLEPLAETSGYVSLVLPQLYHEAGLYEKLIALALSEDFLPERNPIDARNARIFRLQYALKSALKIDNFKDASVLAMRAGEESAGSDRQTYLLQNNIHLVAALREPSDVYELAMKRELFSRWNGSENVYSAALLSKITAYRGEALGLLRSAHNSLEIYFEKQKKQETDDREEELRDDDLLNLGYAILNLKGTEQCTRFFKNLIPKEIIAPIFGNLIRRLIDQGEHEMIDQLMADAEKQPLYILQGTAVLFDCGMFCDKKLIKPQFKKLELKPRSGPEPTLVYDDHSWTSRMDFAETAIYHQLPSADILAFLDKNSRIPSTNSLTHTRSFNQLDHLMRTLAVLGHLNGSEPDLEKVLVADSPTKKRSYDQERTFVNKKKIVQAILPWYILRLEVIASGGILEPDALGICNKKSKQATVGLYLQDDPVPGTIARVCLEILKFASKTSGETLNNFYSDYIKDNKNLYVNSLTHILHAAQRLEHLRRYREQLEDWTYNRINHVESGGPDEVALAYARLACATLIGSDDNAAFYFGKAVDILSKVGEERAYRWDAVVPLAKKAATSKTDQQQLAYRFIRVAENIWEHAREKHWSRTDAMITSVQLSPGGGAAALSRWRDREIGDCEWMHHFMLRELVQSWELNPLWAWSLTSLTNSGDFHSAVEGFLKSPNISTDQKQIILEDGIARLKKEEANNNYWLELHLIATAQGLKSANLEQYIEQFAKPDSKKKDYPYDLDKDYRPNLPWEEILKGLNLLTETGITEANNRLSAAASKSDVHIQRYMLWNEILPKIEARNAISFLNEALRCDWMESYDMEVLLQRLPQSWLNRPAFQQKLPSLIKDVGSRFAWELTGEYRYSNMVKTLPAKDQATKWLESGIIVGLAEKPEFADSEQLFGLARLSAPILQPDEAAQALDFALKRFEVHIEDDFGNGPWEETLLTSACPKDAVTNYLWTTLASPTAATRWRGAHAVVRLARYGQNEALASLIKRAEVSLIDAFSYSNYPFYELSAKLYLMIACARIALEHPEMLKPHAREILRYITSSNHAVIMKFASDCANRLAQAFPGLYNENELLAIDPMTQSMGTITQEELEREQESPEPKDFDVDEYEEDEDDDKLFYFDSDFKEHWMIDVAEAFGISITEVIKMTSDIIIKEWKICLNAYRDDPRSEIWDKATNHDRTTHRWGYPDDDEYRFYVSYHAVMMTAVRLLRSRPLIEREYNSWKKMLTDHVTTREDGYWIADWRDDVPDLTSRPKDESFDEWQNGISTTNFLGALHSQIPQGWISLAGMFKEEQESRLETIHIESALVDTETSNALLNALNNYERYSDYQLPAYGDNRKKIKAGPFQLSGWITNGENSTGLDEKDPFADELPAGPYRIGDDFTALLGLLPSADQKSYALNNNPMEDVIQVRQWASSRSSKEECAAQRGNLISCKLDALRTILSQLNKALILEVRIDRNYYSTHRSVVDKKKPTLHHLFIINADGTIRDTKQSY
jgi:hypothetical protein